MSELLETFWVNGKQYKCKPHSIKGRDSHTFYYNAILDLNNLPDDIKSIPNILTYKNAVKRYLLTAGQFNEAYILATFKQIF